MNNIPLETAFMSNSSRAWRDPNIKNRIHFRLPDNWVHQISNNSKVIGIRNMFIARSYKHPIIEVTCKLMQEIYTKGSSSTPPTTTEQEVATRRIRIDYFFDYDTELKDYVNHINKMCETIDFSNNFTVKNDNNSAGLTKDAYETLKQLSNVITYYEYLPDSNNNNFNYSRVVFESPFNTELNDIRSYWTINSMTSTEMCITYFNKFDVVLLNEDAESILKNREGTDNEQSIYYNNIWDRNSCIVFSNISEECDNGYLGFTRKQGTIAEIKKYNINDRVNTFWIDLYSSKDRKVRYKLG